MDLTENIQVLLMAPSLNGAVITELTVLTGINNKTHK